MKAAYVKSVKMRGVVEGVRGEPWLVQRVTGDLNGASPSYYALSFASLCEAFYHALEEDGTNENLLLSLSKGLECRVLHHRTPGMILKYLVNLHNRFHQGSSTSWVELIQIVPDAPCHKLVCTFLPLPLPTLLFLKYNGAQWCSVFVYCSTNQPFSTVTTTKLKKLFKRANHHLLIYQSLFRRRDWMVGPNRNQPHDSTCHLFPKR